MPIVKHSDQPQGRQRPPLATAPAPGRPERRLRRGSGLVGRILRTGCIQSLVAHAVVLTTFGMIVHSADRVSAPIRLTVAPPAEAEEPVIEEAMFTIDVESPTTLQSEDEPVPSEAVVFEPLNVEAGLIELEPSAAPTPAWFEFTSDEMAAELVPSPRDARPQPSESRSIKGVVHQAVATAEPPGAIGGELGRRLQAAGAQTGDVQVSIRWDGINDIDLHVMVEPLGWGPRSRICWQQKFGPCGGMLDVDANAHQAQLTPRPVENVFWGRGRAPFGRYTVAVHHYMPWSRLPRTPVEVAVLVDGKVTTFQVVATSGEPPRVVTSFIRHPVGATDQLAAAIPGNGKE